MTPLLNVDYFGMKIIDRMQFFQNAVRDGNVEQALKSFFVGYNMPKYYPNYLYANEIQKKFMLHIVTIACSDIELANPILVFSIIRHVHRILNGSIENNPRILGTIIYRMCTSPKSNYCTYLTKQYANGEYEASIDFKSHTSIAIYAQYTHERVFSILINSMLLEYRNKISGLYEIAKYYSNKLEIKPLLRFGVCLTHFLHSNPNADRKIGFIHTEMKREMYLLVSEMDVSNHEDPKSFMWLKEKLEHNEKPKYAKLLNQLELFNVV